MGTSGKLCAGHFTLADLEASGADTVVMADTAAYFGLTATELQALQEYAEQGHTLVGLSVDFEGRRHDDNALAPLFVLVEQPAWHANGADRGAPPTYKLRLNNPAAPMLFRDVPNPYGSSAAGFEEKPPDKALGRE